MIIADARERAVFQPDKMGKSGLAQGDHLYAGLNALEPGQEHAAHIHADQDKLYVILQGEAVVTLDGEVAQIGVGGVILANAGVPHGIRNPGPDRLIVLVVFSPPPKR
jgi:mannose-6-phosphate isomerase-like protein (cupin superfamily)